MPRVVVVGASFAGLYAAKGLRRVADVVLIDASDEWEYTPAVHEVLGGHGKARHDPHFIYRNAAGRRIYPRRRRGGA